MVAVVDAVVDFVEDVSQGVDVGVGHVGGEGFEDEFGWLWLKAHGLSYAVGRLMNFLSLVEGDRDFGAAGGDARATFLGSDR